MSLQLDKDKLLKQRKSNNNSSNNGFRQKETKEWAYYIIN